MTLAEKEKLARKFHTELVNSYHEAKELGYNAPRFKEMLDTHGGVDTARKLVVSGDIQTGFETLKKMGRLDLATETIMQKPEYAPLFTKEELDAAKWRLGRL